MRSIPTAMVVVCGLTAVLAWSAPAAAASNHNPSADSPAAAAAGDVVIQEFTPAGVFASDDEYVLLRNHGDQVVELDGWSFRACTPSGILFKIVVFGVVVQPGGFLLLAGRGYSGLVSPDVRYSGDVPEDGGWLLRDGHDAHVDGVGLSAGLPCTEGDPAPDCGWDLGAAASRDQDGTDTDNNADDFTCQSRSPGL